MTGKPTIRRRPSHVSRMARELNIADAAGMLIMLRHDHLMSLDKIDTALKMLIGIKAVRELQRKAAEATAE